MTEMPAPVAHLTISDNMTIYNAQSQKERLLDALEGAQHLDLDLSGVADMDSAGLQLLMLVKREAVQQGKNVSISGHSPIVHQVLDFYNLVSVFGDPVVIPAQR